MVTFSGVQAPVELLRALALLAEPPEAAHAAVADALTLDLAPDGAAYADVFLFQFYPYASVYLGAEGMLGGEARDRIAGFWRAVGRTPPAEPDHLSALLGLYAQLLDEAAAPGARVEQGDPGASAETTAEPMGVVAAEAAERTMIRQSATALLHEHLAPWIFHYLDRMARDTSGFYQAWATLTGTLLRGEMATAGVPERLPVHLREAPPLPDPRVAGGQGFAGQLLTPVRTGMIITRADLGAVGRSLGLGLRLGERRFMLEILLDQDATGVLGAMSGMAASAAEAHTARRDLLGPIADFWAERARSAAALLASLARDGGVALNEAAEGAP